MWTREILKTRGKENFNRVYASAVVVSLIFTILTTVLDSGQNSSSNMATNSQVEDEYYLEDEYFNYNNTFDATNSLFRFSIDGSIGSLLDKLMLNIENSLPIIGAVAFINVFLIIMILFLIIRVLILYPIEIGKNFFFMGIRESDRSVKDMFYVFKRKNLLTSVFTMFCKNLFTVLWTLLLVIPGIIKAYEYRMIPYILAENPGIERSRAFELSRYMMSGQKYDTFILDLSFIGWNLLSGFTLGILGIFYVNPYIEATNAELYAVLRESVIESGFSNREELPGFTISI